MHCECVVLSAQAPAQRGARPPAKSAHLIRFVFQRSYGCQGRHPHRCMQSHGRCPWCTPFTDACAGGVFSLQVCSAGRSGRRVRLLLMARISAIGRRLRAHQGGLLLGQATPMSRARSRMVAYGQTPQSRMVTHATHVYVRLRTVTYGYARSHTFTHGRTCTACVCVCAWCGGGGVWWCCVVCVCGGVWWLVVVVVVGGGGVCVRMRSRLLGGFGG